MWEAPFPWGGGRGGVMPPPPLPLLLSEGSACLDGGNSREPVSPGNDSLCNAARLRTATCWLLWELSDNHPKWHVSAILTGVYYAADLLK